MSAQKDSFSKFITLSVGFHAAVFLILTVKILFFPSEAPEHQQAVRVDVVALPEKNVEPPKLAEKKPEPVAQKPPSNPEPPKPKPKPKPKVAEKKPKPVIKKKAPKPKEPDKKVREDQNSAIARLKAMQKLKEQQERDAAKQQEFKGNQLSKGNSLSGLAKLHHDSYLDELDGHIRSYWNLPEWLANGNFKARVLLLIDKDGGIKSKSFVMKSGNDLFDQHVFSTLEKATPLPVPPPNLVDFYASKGVEIRFPE